MENEEESEEVEKEEKEEEKGEEICREHHTFSLPSNITPTLLLHHLFRIMNSNDSIHCTEF